MNKKQTITTTHLLVEQERTLIKGESSLYNFLEDMRLDSNNFFLFHDDIKLLFANKLWQHWR